MVGRKGGWRALADWSLALGLAVLVVLGSATIGLFLMPLAVAACWVVARRDRLWPEGIMGALIGTGCVCLLVAFLNRASGPCIRGPAHLAKGQHSSCGGLEPLPWIAAGAVSLVLGIAGYIILRRFSAAAPDRAS